MEEILRKIEKMSAGEVQSVIQAVTIRFSLLHPDCDLAWFCLHKDPPQRKRELAEIIGLIRETAE